MTQRSNSTQSVGREPNDTQRAFHILKIPKIPPLSCWNIKIFWPILDWNAPVRDGLVRFTEGLLHQRPSIKWKKKINPTFKIQTLKRDILCVVHPAPLSPSSNTLCTGTEHEHAAQHSTAAQNTAEHSRTQQNTAEHSTTQQNTAEHSRTQQNTAKRHGANFHQVQNVDAKKKIDAKNSENRSSYAFLRMDVSNG